VVQYINERGVSVLLVEQNVSLAFRISTRGYALQVGRVVSKGDVEQLKSSKTIRKAYLGG
jgi:branched-chain amino acid transport system ATP-binding protein